MKNHKTHALFGEFPAPANFDESYVGQCYNPNYLLTRIYSGQEDFEIFCSTGYWLAEDVMLMT